MNRNLLSKLLKLRKFLIWLPTLTIITGLWLTFALYDYLSTQEKNNRINENIRRAQEITDRIDLSLGNSILRIESYEELIGFKPEKRLLNNDFLKSALPYTIFQRLTIFREIKGEGSKNRQKALKVIFRLTLPQSSLPKATSDYLESEDIYEKIDYMKRFSKPSEAFLFEREGSVRISVVLRSKVNKDIYFFFTAPFETLFRELDLGREDKVLVSHFNGGPQWVLTYSPKEGLHISANTTSESSEVVEIGKELPHKLKHSSLPVVMRFLFSDAQLKEFSVSNVVAATGAAITFVLSFLFYVLIGQSRRTAMLLAERTSSLESTAQHLQDALETKNKFLGKVSHEIRTPLNLILGMIDLCLEENLGSKVGGYLGGMKSSGEHLLFMIDDLIDLAKSDSTHLQFLAKPIHTTSFFPDMLKMIGRICEKKNLKFFAHIDPSMPQSFISDPNRLRQILMNLLRNASKYTNEGYVLFRARYLGKDPSVEAGVFVFEVEDSGLGIARDKLDKIFEAFFQVEEHASSSDGGVGLGLSIVRDLVKAMNGVVSVDSKPGRGSVFRVTLKLPIQQESPWIDLYKNPTPAPTRVFIISNDSNFCHSFDSLKLKAELLIEFVSPQDFVEVLGASGFGAKDDWFVFDSREDKYIFEKIEKYFSKGRVIIFGSESGYNLNFKDTYLTAFPPLITDLLPKLGYSSRLRVRQGGASEPKASAATMQTQSLIGSQAKVLVADDDLGNIELYKAYFSATACQVEYVGDGQLAWQRYLSMKPDICIIDVRMPILDGFQVVDNIRQFEIKENIKPTPILLITADLVEIHEERIKNYAKVKLLNKPIRKAHLFARIAESLAEANGPEK